MFKEVWFANFEQLASLYMIVFFTLVFLLYKYRNSIIYVLIVLLFYPAIFDVFGKSTQDIYKVIILFLTIWVCIRRKIIKTFEKTDISLTIIFALFSFFYFVSAYLSNDNWTIIFSQYSRYFIAYCIWFLIRNEIKIKKNVDILSSLVYDVILMQIIISIGKFIIFRGKQIESIVGSVSHIGGAAGTIIPLYGFIALWIYRKGTLLKRDWLYIAGLMLIGFLAGKRAVWFIMPLIIATFLIYIPQLRVNASLCIGVLFAPLAFYFGIRLTPTLNSDHKVWGRFDLEYTLDYANKYQFGEGKDYNDQIQGRGGASISLLKKMNSNSNFTMRDWFGQGFSQMYATDYEEFSKINPKLDSKGSATGVYQTYITTGYIGILMTIIFFFYMVSFMKNKRLRNVFFIILAWEYLMYTGITFRTPAFMFIIIYLIHYSNYLSITYKLNRLRACLNFSY